MNSRFEISKISAMEVLDSRGYPTVRATVHAKAGFRGSFSVPAGASKGKGEAMEMRDGGKRLSGRGVRQAIAAIGEVISPLLVGRDVRDQREIDDAMITADGTENKSRLGANSLLAVSIACAKAAACGTEEPLFRYMGGEGATLLPVPLLNVINGGAHAGNDLAVQEFMCLPAGFKTFGEALMASAQVYHKLAEILVSRHGKSAKNVGDEGGYAPPIKETAEALEVLHTAIIEAGYEGRIYLGMDCAANNFYDGEAYRIDGKRMSTEELSEFYLSLLDQYPLISIEDPFREEDLLGFSELTREVGSRVQLVGDDFFVTNPKKLAQGLEMSAGNAILIKPNQIGTLRETIDVARMAAANQYTTVMSHRSGETTDYAIADLSVALNCGQIKAGAPARGERVVKYNRLLEIEKELGALAKFKGLDAFRSG